MRALSGCEQYRGVPPYYETRAYVARIVRDFNRKKAGGTESAAKKHDHSNNPSRTALASQSISEAEVCLSQYRPTERMKPPSALPMR